jgi:NAD(P)-dependent dehydrogenase (short-subunit alcohol dehydrogenase family)
MTHFASGGPSKGAADRILPRGERPRVLITGACRGVGRACAELFAARGAELILADHDATELGLLSHQLGAMGRYCDVASEASVTVFAADILARFPELDMVVNAAGGGYERTLGMYRVSRALLPALRKGMAHNILFNIPPAGRDSDAAIFPYASSKQAFQRLCAALAAESRGSPVRVLIGCPITGNVSQVLPDHNARHLAEACEAAPREDNELGGLAEHIVALCDPAPQSRNVA